MLKEVFQALFDRDVALEGMILKPNMIVPARNARHRTGVAEVAQRTVQVLKRCVPSAVPGIAFLSGGQSDEEATAHLSAMNAVCSLPWPLTFSYGRALQAAPQKAWCGKAENVASGADGLCPPRRDEFGLAAMGKWTKRKRKRAA